MIRKKCSGSCSAAPPPDAVALAIEGTWIVTSRDGKRRKRCAVADVELLKDVMEMHFDRAVSDIQSTTNLLVRQTFGYQTHDLTLAHGQRNESFLGYRARLLSRRFPERGQLQQLLAARHLPQDLHENLRVHIL